MQISAGTSHAGLAGAARQHSNRVARLSPKHAAGRARRALRCQAAMPTTVCGGSSFMGARVAPRRAAVAPMTQHRNSRSRGVAVRAMFERFTEKAIKVVMLAQVRAG